MAGNNAGALTFMTKALEAELLEGIRTWVEIESQTPHVEGVNAVMDLVEAGYSSAGAKVSRIAGRDGYGDHLSISAPWGGEGPGILVLCHLDTVHPTGTLEILPFKIDGDRAYGPGTYDMKGGAYLAFAAFRALMQESKTPPLPLRLLYVSDEETGSATSRELIEAAGENAKYVLVTEPARDGGKIVIARKGVARYVISTEGQPSHSGSQHHLGRSAIKEMAHQIIAIEAMTDYDKGITTSIGTIEGGTTLNTISQHCAAGIDVRVMDLADAEEIERRIRALKPVDPDVTITITGGINRPPFRETNASAVLFGKAHALAAEIGFELEGVATGGGSDGNFVAAKAPVLDGLGVDGNGAHTLEEHLLISSLVPRMMLQKRLFETLE